MPDEDRAPAGAQERATASEILRRRYAGDDLVRQAAIDAERAAIPPVCDLPPAKYGCELYAGHEGPCRALVGTAEEVSWLAPQPQGDRAALVERLSDIAQRAADADVFREAFGLTDEEIATLREVARLISAPAEATERPAPGEAEPDEWMCAWLVDGEVVSTFFHTDRATVEQLEQDRKRVDIDLEIVPLYRKADPAARQQGAETQGEG